MLQKIIKLPVGLNFFLIKTESSNLLIFRLPSGIKKQIPDNVKPMARRMRSRCQDTWKASQNLLNFYLSLN